MNKIKCNNCHGDMVEKETQIKAGWGEYKLTIDGVKGFVCEDCGEKIYASQEIQMVENISKSMAESKNIDKPEYLNVSETADLLRVSNQTIYNMIKAGRIKAVKFGREWRFLRKNIESLINVETSFAVRENDK